MNVVSKAINKALRRNIGELGDCEYEVSSDNGVKPHVIVVGDSLEITGVCRCGEETGHFSISNKDSLIKENAISDARQQDMEGRRRRIQIDCIDTISCGCDVCGRQWQISVHWVLNKQWLKNFDEKYQHGHETLLYGDTLEIDVEVKNGYIETERRQPLDLFSMLNPKHACTTSIGIVEVRDAVQTMIEGIDNFWNNGAEPPHPKRLNLKVKCPLCLGELSVVTTLTPKLPDKNASIPQIINQYEAWQNREKT